jgi:hypothetical protein
MKAQVVIDKKRKKILYVLVGKGREHDFKLFKRCGIKFHELGEVLGDRGYQGLQHFHTNSQTPQRKPPKQPLSKTAKRRTVNWPAFASRLNMLFVTLNSSASLKKLTAINASVLGLDFTLIAAICNLTHAR